MTHSDGRAKALDIVREQQANTSELFLERQCLAFELDSMVSQNIRPDIGLRRNLHIGVSELEDEFRIADGETILVWNSPAQNERVVIEAEVFRINEQHFSELHWLCFETSAREPDAVLFGGLAHDLSEIEQAFARNKLVRPKNQLAAEVLDLVDRHSVCIRARLELRNTPDPTGGHRLSFLQMLNGVF